MLEIFSTRQRELLRLLLKKKSGMTVDELSARLGIAHNAVRQHIATLEKDGFVTKARTRPSGGRPEQLYALTGKGNECFPRHYSWFAQLLVESIQHDTGSDGFGDRLNAMGAKVGAQLRNQHPELKSREAAVEKLSEIMEQMGYDARGTPTSDAGVVIEADNCIYHHLAMANPNICKFDLALLSAFTDSAVDHQECMANGGNVCRFRFHAKAD
jgi:predicted ArsR family transcriptional regulator